MTWWVLKAMGFLKGAPDLIIAKTVRWMEHHAGTPESGPLVQPSMAQAILFVEFKSADAGRTAEQERFGRWCALHSYDYEVVRTFDRFVRLMGEHGIGA